MEENICSCGVHENIVEKVAKVMPDKTVLYDAAELLKVFGDDHV